MTKTMKKRLEQLENGVIDLCTTASQLKESLCGNKKATNKELLAAVDQLKSRLAQAEKERDAAVRDCARFPCFTCTERENGDYCPQCRTTGTFRSLHEWRGPCPENTPDPAKE